MSHRPEIPAELVSLTRRPATPPPTSSCSPRPPASVRLPDGTFAVKASGSRMDDATPGDFLIADPEPLLAALSDPGASQETLSGLLNAEPDAEGRPRRASIETLMHVGALEYGGATWVAHTHPTAVVGLLAVQEAEELWAAPLFPDEAVVVGPPAWVPYTEPGLTLGRAVVASISEYADREGVPPRLVLLGNHGIVALGSTPAEVEAVTTMCVKAARVCSVVLGAGRPAPLDDEHARALAGRADEAARHARLGGSPVLTGVPRRTGGPSPGPCRTGDADFATAVPAALDELRAETRPPPLLTRRTRTVPFRRASAFVRRLGFAVLVQAGPPVRGALRAVGGGSRDPGSGCGSGTGASRSAPRRSCQDLVSA